MRKNGVALVAGTVAVLVFATAAEAKTQFQWWHAMSGVNNERVDKIASDFNASQDEYEIVPTYKGNYTETMTAAVAAFRAGEQPQIVQVFEVGTATMMKAEGAVYPVFELMAEAGEPFNQNDYLPAVVSYYTTADNKLLSLPFNSSTPVMWYNKDAFKAAGLDPDNPPKTWQEVGEASKALKASGLPCGFSVGWQSWVLVENMSAWHDQPVGTKGNGFEGTDTELVFNKNAIVPKLIAQLAEWQKDKTFDYGGRRGDSLPKFTTGECGMWLNSSAYYGSIKEQAGFDFGITMLPYDSDVVDAPQNSIIGGATLWVLKGGTPEQYKGVAKFFNYLSSPEVQAWWHQETGYVPITLAASELSREQGFYDKAPGADTAVRELSLNIPTENSKGVRFGNFVQIRDVINEELEAVWAGSKSAQDALDTAVERGNELLRKFER
ncbi:MAG: sn-glycerol-3-phosphate ABC transporter substrate-binding protein UgpB [Geminicoccaceae bacterium]|nr:sn-glycerol-3-phosphate ABC transporter substrate-binding protein UgpB [Geminicoccaceae bacterium]